MTLITDWPAHAACIGIEPDRLFVQGAAQNRAKVICAGCLVRTECLADALDNRIEFGVWGGMTERERRSLLRRRPDVLSWHSMLDNARINHEQTAALPGQNGGATHQPAIVTAQRTSPEDARVSV